MECVCGHLHTSIIKYRSLTMTIKKEVEVTIGVIHGCPIFSKIEGYPEEIEFLEKEIRDVFQKVTLDTEDAFRAGVESVTFMSLLRRLLTNN